MKKTKYIIDFPQLLAEWHWDKNQKIGYAPETISYGSAKKVWWICEKGHEWEASPNDRSGGRGCPVCAEAMRRISRQKNMVTSRGSVAQLHPEIAEQWHPTLNGSLSPEDVTPSSGRKAWWMCSKGHEREAVISSRTKGVGCPICSGHKVLVGYNDLATVCPEIARQWHPTKNSPLTPQDFTKSSSKKVWWICDKGHEWATTISNRHCGNNCPVCNGKKVVAGFNDLATTNPQIAAQWHPTKNGNLLPTMVTAFSNKVFWWICDKGHEWRMPLNKRSSGSGCPECAKELKTSFPEQAIFFYFSQITDAQNRYMVDNRTEIDIFLPQFNIGIEYDGIYFHSGKKAETREKSKEKKLRDIGIYLIRVKEVEKTKIKEKVLVSDSKTIIFTSPGPRDVDLGKTIEEVIKQVCIITRTEIVCDIDIKRDRAKIYERYIESDKKRSLLALNPALATEWHPTKNGSLMPSNVTVSSNKRVWWRCSKGHEWEAEIKSRNSGFGCPYCAGLYPITGETDLKTKHPLIALQWHPTKNGELRPEQVSRSSNKRAWWICEKGHEYDMVVSHRVNGANCPFCSGKRVLIGDNDLGTTHPHIAKQWNYAKNGSLTPQEVTAGSDKKVWWICEKGHEWEAHIYSRKAGVNCPYCGGKKLLVGYNDLATTNPSLSEDWHPTKNGSLTPRDVMGGTKKKAWWRCPKGHEWEAVVSSRSSGNGCPFCAGQIVIAGENDLATLNPALAAQWHPTRNGDLSPSQVSPGSNKKIWWRCSKGHEWNVAISTRAKGNGCPYCAGQRVIPGENDLATVNPQLASEWHPTKNGSLTPRDVMGGTNKKAWWRCSKGHEWEALISSRNKGVGCPYCAGKKVLSGYNDLVTLKPLVAAQWHPTMNGDLLPSQVSSGSNKKFWWRCEKGHIWQSSPNKRKKSGRCPICSRKPKT